MTEEQQAFPCYTWENERFTGAPIKVYHPGMTLREWYAGMALSGSLPDRALEYASAKGIAIRAFEVADEMILKGEQHGDG